MVFFMNFLCQIVYLPLNPWKNFVLSHSRHLSSFIGFPFSLFHSSSFHLAILLSGPQTCLLPSPHFSWVPVCSFSVPSIGQSINNQYVLHLSISVHVGKYFYTQCHLHIWSTIMPLISLKSSVTNPTSHFLTTSSNLWPSELLCKFHKYPLHFFHFYNPPTPSLHPLPSRQKSAS